MRNGLMIKQYFDCLAGAAKGALSQSIGKRCYVLSDCLMIAQLFERLFFKNRERSVTRKNEENGFHLPKSLMIAQLFERLRHHAQEHCVTQALDKVGFRLAESLIIGQLFNPLSPKMQEWSMTQICRENGLHLAESLTIAQLFNAMPKTTQSCCCESRGENADYRSFSRLVHRPDSNRRRFWAAFMQCARHAINFGSTDCLDNAI